MNEYNYDYLGINGIIPSNTLNPMNNIPNNNMTINKKPDINYSQNTNTDLLDPTNGFIKGNMFNNLYNTYKNYKPNNLNPKNEKEAILMNLQQYNFALTDLNLYLDNYPNDRNIINLYKQYLNIYKDIKTEYEKKYGPLKTSSIYIGDNNWKWDNSPWPWEGIDNV